MGPSIPSRRISCPALTLNLREKLSELEWRVLQSYLDGKSYREIAEEIDRDAKVVDNALCRIKIKIRNHVEPLLN